MMNADDILVPFTAEEHKRRFDVKVTKAVKDVIADFAWVVYITEKVANEFS